MTRVSIAMATYNGAPYVGAQLASFVSQTRRPDELVVTDDGSTDDTVEIVRAFAQSAPFPVRIEPNPVNLGYAQNFNRALTLCTGELVFLSDQDDVWLEDKIARMVALAETNPGRGCFMNDARLTDASLQPAGVTKWGQIRAAGLPDSAFVMGCCAAFRRSLLELLLPIPPKSRSHDNWLVEASEMLGLVLRTDETLQLYRRHGGNASDFHVNRIQRPGLGERIVLRFGSLMRRLRSSSSLDAEWRFLNEMLGRLNERRNRCEALQGAERAGEALSRLERKVQHLQQRRQWQALPRWQRLRPVFTHWFGGQYEAGGWRSALKDLWVSRENAPEDRL